MPERRQWPRYQIDWPITIRGTDPSGARFIESGRLRNISVKGALGNIGRLLGIGSQVEVFIRFPFARPQLMKYSGEVIRTEPDPSGINVAVQFHTTRPTFLDSEPQP